MNWRDTLRGLSARLAPEERSRVAGSMRQAMVHARMALDDVRKAIAETETRISAERTELETTQRRGALANGIGDSETAAIAERFAAQHAERVRVLEMKLLAQQQELTLGERELDEMRSQLRLAMSGVAASPDAQAREIENELDAMLAGEPNTSDGLEDLGESAPRRTRAEREADAEERLAALKRRMGR